MRYFIYTVIIIIAAAIVTGFFVVGSPKEERMRRFDEQRVQALQMIQSHIGEFYRAKEILPKNLEELNDQFRGVVIPKDPETGATYEYEVKSRLSFALCADFNKPNIDEPQGVEKPIPAPSLIGHSPFGLETWAHGEGKTCFDRNIDPDFFFPKGSPRP